MGGGPWPSPIMTCVLPVESHRVTNFHFSPRIRLLPHPHAPAGLPNPLTGPFLRYLTTPQPGGSDEIGLQEDDLIAVEHR